MISCQCKSWVLGVNLNSSNAVLNKCRFSSRNRTQFESKIPRGEYFFNEERTVEIIGCKSFGKQNVTCFEVVSRISDTENFIRSRLRGDLNGLVKNCTDSNLLERSYIINLQYCRLIFLRIDSNSATNTQTIVSNEIGIAKDFFDSDGIPVLICLKVFEGCIITQRIKCLSMSPGDSTICCSPSSVGRCSLRCSASNTTSVEISTEINLITDVIYNQRFPKRLLGCWICSVVEVNFNWIG